MLIGISHSGLDSKLIRRAIIPTISKKFGPDGYFFHSRLSGGAHAYREIVQIALHYCNKFLLVLSLNSISNKWVKAEVTWAIFHKKPIILCLMDNSRPAQLHPVFKQQHLEKYTKVEFYCIDFNAGIEEGQKLLGQILDKLLCH